MKLFFIKASGAISDKVVVSLPGLREQDLTRLGPKSNCQQRPLSLMMTMMRRRKGTWTQVKLPSISFGSDDNNGKMERDLDPC